jgi:hypothetical protein
MKLLVELLVIGDGVILTMTLLQELLKYLPVSKNFLVVYYVFKEGEK